MFPSYVYELQTFTEEFQCKALKVILSDLFSFAQYQMEGVNINGMEL